MTHPGEEYDSEDENFAEGARCISKASPHGTMSASQGSNLQSIKK